jgi:hypothetical protein
LKACVNRPEFTKLEFLEDVQLVRLGSALCTLRTLQRAAANDIEKLLHYVVFQRGHVVSPKPIEHTEKERWTRALMQYGRKSENIYKELGPWATDYFVQKTNELYTVSTETFTRVASRYDEVLSKILAKHFD